MNHARQRARELAAQAARRKPIAPVVPSAEDQRAAKLEDDLSIYRAVGECLTRIRREWEARVLGVSPAARGDAVQNAARDDLRVFSLAEPEVLPDLSKPVRIG